ncbi:hypothetical protein MRX96_006879 [Rhipicephalus microplus]
MGLDFLLRCLWCVRCVVDAKNESVHFHRFVTRVSRRGHFACPVVAGTGCPVHRGRTGFRRRPLQTKRAAAERVIPARRAPLLQRDGDQVRRFLAHRRLREAPSLASQVTVRLSSCIPVHSQ